MRVESINEGREIGKQINKASFGLRIGSYIVGYIFLLVVWTVIVIGNDLDPFGLIGLFNKRDFMGLIASLTTLCIPPLLPIILKEWLVRIDRRSQGLSVYGDISEELEQMEVDRVMAMEESGRAKAQDSVNKNSIEYWFELKEKGAITEAEYEVKKSELL